MAVSFSLSLTVAVTVMVSNTLNVLIEVGSEMVIDGAVVSLSFLQEDHNNSAVNKEAITTGVFKIRSKVLKAKGIHIRSTIVQIKR